MKRERLTTGPNPQPVRMVKPPPVFVVDDPARFLDPTRHAWRGSGGNPLHHCTACGRAREQHTEANEEGKVVKVRA